MALLIFDGFDHYGVSASPASGVWAENNNVLTVAAPVRTGTHSIDAISNGTYIVTKPLVTSGGAIVGFAFYLSGAITVGTDILQIREGTTVHMAVALTTGNLFIVKRGTTTLLTGTTVIVSGAWYHIALKTVIHDTTGSYELRVDNVTELSQSGIDTRNAGTGIWDRVLLQGTSSGDNFFDDFYVCDMSGSAPRNDFLGAVKVETIYPQTDAVAVGSNAGLTPSTGTDHGALVDETTPNTTDYNSASVVGLKDTYQYPAMTLTGTVYGVQTKMLAAKSDTAPRQVCPVVRMAGVDTDGTNVTLSTTFVYYDQVWAQNPNAGSPIEWTTGDIASIQAGMKITV